jgi:hypothetical protein
MAVNCPNHVFDKLWAVAPDDTSDPDVIAFAYENISDADYLSAECPALPELGEATLQDWHSLDEWLSAQLIQVCMWEPSIDDLVEPSVDIDDGESGTPLLYFGSKEQFLDRLAGIIEEEMDKSGNFEFCCLEVCCGEKKVTIFYHSADAWALGHGHSVRVAK